MDLLRNHFVSSLDIAVVTFAAYVVLVCYFYFRF